jgi:methyl-accepting chemotaxis protein
MRIFLVIALLILSLQAKSLFSNKEQESNAKYISELKNLVIATQKTRGLTNSYLNGNESALLLIQANKRDMKKAIGEMESLPLSSNPIISSRATSISQALIRLNSKAMTQKASTTFKAYTEQIEQILMLAQTVSKQGSSQLNKLGKEASSIMMESILPLTEQIGRLRGMGSGIIAKKSMKDTQKYAMVAMISEIEDLESKLQAQMSLITASNSEYYSTTVTTDLQKLDKAVKEYVSLTNSKVIASHGASGYSASEYFDKGTDIISTLMLIFDANKKAIVSDSKGWI